MFKKTKMYPKPQAKPIKARMTPRKKPQTVQKLDIFRRINKIILLNYNYIVIYF